ncbi:MAG: M15 family metallopeptidase [bacterium]
MPIRHLALSPMRRAALLAAMFALAACRATSPAQGTVAASASDLAPPAPAARWLGLIGEYGPDSNIHIVLERDGALVVHSAKAGSDAVLAEVTPDSFSAVRPNDARMPVVFARSSSGPATRVSLGGMSYARRQIGPESGNQLVITPVRPLAEVRREALAASPPVEAGPFRPADLVELVKLDPTIKLDIRYATTNNLFGVPFYTEARAFLQRPAAQALVRVSAALRAKGFGLLVHDGYRPWSVTKMFWDAAPEDKHIFVADPAQGSKHNRGEAVDITLYDLSTGAPIEMVSTYDETTDRAAARYAGGTSRQRWHRDLLRRFMEAEQFAVIQSEWWHFDYVDWKQYGIGNIPFDTIH